MFVISSSVFLSRPHGIWPQQDVGVRFSYLEGRRKATEEAEGPHLGLLSSRAWPVYGRLASLVRLVRYMGFRLAKYVGLG